MFRMAVQTFQTTRYRHGRKRKYEPGRCQLARGGLCLACCRYGLAVAQVASGGDAKDRIREPDPLDRHSQYAAGRGTGFEDSELGARRPAIEREETVH
jgi:hypothetical protein